MYLDHTTGHWLACFEKPGGFASNRPSRLSQCTTRSVAPSFDYVLEWAHVCVNFLICMIANVCWVVSNDKFLNQFDTSAGVIFRF